VNVKFIAGLIFLVLLFVLGFGSELFIGAWRQTTPYKLEEPPEKMKDRLRSFRQEAAYKGPPSRMGNTLADARFVAALNSMEIEQKQREARTREKREIERFLETNVGQYLSQGLEMLTKGRREEARSYIKHALSLHTELEHHIYVILLKTLLHSYVEEKDRKELDVAVLKYLETIRYDYDNAEFEKVVAEVMKKIEDKVRYGDQ
jgi:hypothetical protein